MSEEQNQPQRTTRGNPPGWRSKKTTLLLRRLHHKVMSIKGTSYVPLKSWARAVAQVAEYPGVLAKNWLRNKEMV